MATTSVLCACHRGAAETAATPAASPAAAHDPAAGGAEEAKAGSTEEAKAGGVSLTPEEIAKLGLSTTTLATVAHTEEVPGYGVVLPHEAVATAVAELMTAEATVRQSHSTLARQKSLAGTPGALSADFAESAIHQVAVDDAALTLAQRRLATVVGLDPPWNHPKRGASQLQDVAAGKLKLVRATFPVGTFASTSPTTFRVSPLGTNRPGGAAFIKAIWAAPADSNIPGRSFFGLWSTNEVGEGERLRVWGPSGEEQQGVIVPSAALVMSGGKYWCYVEKEDGKFSKVEIDIDKPVPQGYFVDAGVVADDRVVTTAAGQLLAKESNSSAEPD